MACLSDLLTCAAAISCTEQTMTNVSADLQLVLQSTKLTPLHNYAWLVDYHSTFTSIAEQYASLPGSQNRKTKTCTLSHYAFCLTRLRLCGSQSINYIASCKDAIHQIGFTIIVPCHLPYEIYPPPISPKRSYRFHLQRETGCNDNQLHNSNYTVKFPL